MDQHRKHFAEAASATALVLGGGAWFVDHYWGRAPLLLVDGVGIVSALIGLYALYKWTVVLRAWHDDRANKPATVQEVSAKPAPDMTIRDAFFHIDPDLLENHKEERWETVSRQVRDHLSTGQMASWGRKINPQNKTRSALVSIPAEYWATARFTYFFLESGNEDRGHSWRPHDGELNYEYADIRLNRAQIEAIWEADKIDARRRLNVSQQIARDHVIKIREQRTKGNRLSETLRLDGYSEARREEYDNWVLETRELVQTIRPHYVAVFDDMDVGGIGLLLDVMVEHSTLPWEKKDVAKEARIALIDMISRRCHNLDRICEPPLQAMQTGDAGP